MRRIALWVAMSVVSGPIAAARGDDARAPVPAADEITQARRLVMATYKDEIGAATRPAQVELARKIFGKSREAATEAAMKYVLLELARDVAGAADDEATAFAAIDGLTRDFAVDVAATRIDFLEPRVARTHDAETLSRYVDFLLRDLSVCFERGELAAADRLLSCAQGVAIKAADPDVTLRVTQSRLQLSQLEADHDAWDAANSRLLADPSDPHANFVAGTHLCILLRRWERGLKLLVLGDQPDLAAAAALEAKAQPSGASRLQVADRWCEVAAKQTPFTQLAIRAHAAVWYRRAYPDLKEAEQARVLKKLTEIDPPPPPPKATLKLDPADWRIARHADGKWQTFPIDAAMCLSKGAVLSIKNPGDPHGFAKLAFTVRSFDGDFTVWFKYRGQLLSTSLGDTDWRDRVVYCDKLPCDRTTWRSLVLRRTRDGVTAWVDGTPAPISLFNNDDEFISGYLSVELKNGQEVELRDFAFHGGSLR